MLLTIIYYIASAVQRRRSVCHCCHRNWLQCRRFSLVTNIVAITWMHTGCESSCQFLEAQVISSSLGGWTVTRCPARWGGWSSALITLSSAVLPLPLLLPRFPFPHTVCIYEWALCNSGGSLLYMPVNKFVSGGIEQVRVIQINLTFSHSSSIKVWGAYYIRIFTVGILCECWYYN